MRSAPSRRLSLALLLLSLTPACSPSLSTRSSLARTERPALPARPAELSRTERLEPLTAPETGGLVSIARDALAELYQRLGQAAVAIERGNVRAVEGERLWACVDQIFRTGTSPAACTTPNPDRKD